MNTGPEALGASIRKSVRNPAVCVRIASTRPFSYHIKTGMSWIYFVLKKGEAEWAIFSIEDWGRVALEPLFHGCVGFADDDLMAFVHRHKGNFIKEFSGFFIIDGGIGHRDEFVVRPGYWWGRPLQFARKSTARLRV